MPKDKPIFKYNEHTLTHIGGKKVEHSTLTSDNPQVIATRKRDTGEIIVTTDMYAKYGMHHIYIGGEHIAGGYGFPTLEIRDDLCYIRETYNDVYDYFNNAYIYQKQWNKNMRKDFDDERKYLREQIEINSYKNVKINEKKNRIAFGDISYTVTAYNGTISFLPDEVPYAEFDYDTYYLSYYFSYEDSMTCHIPISLHTGYAIDQLSSPDPITPEILPNEHIEVIDDKIYYKIDDILLERKLDEPQFSYYYGGSDYISNTCNLKWLYPICFGATRLEETEFEYMYNNAHKIMQDPANIADITFELKIPAQNYMYFLIPNSVNIDNLSVYVTQYITDNPAEHGTIEGGVVDEEFDIKKVFPEPIKYFNNYTLLKSDTHNIQTTFKFVLKLK